MTGRVIDNPGRHRFEVDAGDGQHAAVLAMLMAATARGAAVELEASCPLIGAVYAT